MEGDPEKADAYSRGSTVTENLKKDYKTTNEFRNVFKKVSKQFTSNTKIKLMISRGSCLSEYVKLNDTLLPLQDAFYSSLNNSKCSDDCHNLF